MLEPPNHNYIEDLAKLAPKPALALETTPNPKLILNPSKKVISHS